MKNNIVVKLLIILFIIVDIVFVVLIAKESNNKNKVENNTTIIKNENITGQSNLALKDVFEVQNVSKSDYTVDKQVENKVSNMSEGSRIKTYCASYFEDIEKGEYEEAYKMLNETFKNNYFSTQESFEEYAKKTYPTGTISLKYNSLNRKGEIFQVDLVISDDDNESYKPLEQTLVVRENDLNNFTISFSVNK